MLRNKLCAPSLMKFWSKLCKRVVSQIFCDVCKLFQAADVQLVSVHRALLWITRSYGYKWYLPKCTIIVGSEARKARTTVRCKCVRVAKRKGLEVFPRARTDRLYLYLYRITPYAKYEETFGNEIVVKHLDILLNISFEVKFFMHFTVVGAVRCEQC